jgi:transcription antitermination factor NusG
MNRFTALKEGESLPGIFSEWAAGEWVVLHTKSRCEKILSEEMTSQRIDHFLPLLRQVKYYGRRKVFVNEPVFPGYLFLKGTINDAYQAARTKRVANILRVAKQSQIAWELRNLCLAISSGARLDPFSALKKGVRVEVSSGPFRGIQGVVQERAKSTRLILQIETLGRAVSLEVDGAILNAI